MRIMKKRFYSQDEQNLSMFENIMMPEDELY